MRGGSTILVRSKIFIPRTKTIDFENTMKRYKSPNHALDVDFVTFRRTE